MLDSRRSRDRWPSLAVAALVLVAFVVAGATASIVLHLRHPPGQVSGGPGSTRATGPPAALPAAGAFVPAYDLASDPVFPNLRQGYAIESHESGGVSSEHLAESHDGGRTWRLVGEPFPFSAGYSQVQFTSLRDGYVFGPAGLGVTHDGGRHWVSAPSLGGSLQRVVPIGEDVWATYTVCSGPPLPTTQCSVHIAISKNGGLRWSEPDGRSPLSESQEGGDILARVTYSEAYVASYGVSEGVLALTYDAGRSWTKLGDPCARWSVADLAALAHQQLWMVCGGVPAVGATSSPKAVYRSQDGGHSWHLESYTGFGPEPGLTVGPVGHLLFAGQLSQLATISPSRAWIGITGVGVIVSFDGGRDWSLAKGVRDPGRDPAVGVTFNDAVHGWAIEFHEAVWQTLDARHWALVDDS